VEASVNIAYYDEATLRYASIPHSD
jgi:hypothetical protein